MTGTKARFARTQVQLPTGRMVLTGVLVNLFVAVAMAQESHLPIDVVDRFHPYALDSGYLVNPADAKATVFAELIQVASSASLRLYFESVELDEGSAIRVSSLLDGETQTLDSVGLAYWDNTTAYFNGDAVLLELMAAPYSSNNRVVLNRVATDFPQADPRGPPCGICDTDDRLPSSENWAARLMPARCSSAVFSAGSCLISAGHCHGTNMVVQFNVPQSNPSCTLNNPPVSDQFPIINSQFANSGVGNDWAVLVSGPNDIGQLPVARYGQLRLISPTVASVGQPANVTGYGVYEADCLRNRTQQTDNGTIASVFGEFYQFEVDLREGNSGSALLRNDQIVGVVTHCPCPNVATRADRPAFASARTTLCPSPVNDHCSTATTIGNGFTGTNNTNAITDGPDEPTMCNFGGETQILNDIWLKYTATCTGTVTFNLCQSQFDTKLAVYSGHACPTTASAIACDDDSCGTGGTRSTLTLPCTTGEQFLLRIGGKGGATGLAVVQVSCTQATGACCQPSNTCTVTGINTCINGGGVFQGAGTTCTPDPCSAGCALTGDLNGDGLVDGGDIGGYVRAKLGQAPLPGENPDCADYGSGTIAGDNALFIADLLN